MFLKQNFQWHGPKSVSNLSLLPRGIVYKISEFLKMTSTEKKRKMAKNKKKTWRSTDIQDVESFLETKRQDERIG